MHPIVDESQHLVRQMLRQLRDEHQAQPAFTAALGDPGNLLEQHRHLMDALRRQKLVRLFDDDHHRCRAFADRLGFVEMFLLLALHAAQQVGDDEVIHRG
jgi:hypothetical protein